jgi:transcriptional regulator with XRE-family HTH domain
MRTSTQRTTSAVLRFKLQIKDVEMAELLGCSTATIHSLESGRLKLSDAMAMRMFHETGISPEWLLAGDPKAPPVSVLGDPFDKATFDRAQASKASRDTRSEDVLWLDVLDFSARLGAILVSARSGKKYYLARYKAWKAVEALGKEFGQELSIYSPTGSSLSADGEFLEKDGDQAKEVLDRMVVAFAELQAAYALIRGTPVSAESPQRRAKRKRR